MAADTLATGLQGLIDASVARCDRLEADLRREQEDLCLMEELARRYRNLADFAARHQGCDRG